MVSSPDVRSVVSPICWWYCTERASRVFSSLAVRLIIFSTSGVVGSSAFARVGNCVTSPRSNR